MLKTLKFAVEHPGDAGIWPYTDLISVTVISGDPGGALGEFSNHIKKALEDWYDGARVTTAADACTTCCGKGFVNPDDSANNAFEGSDSAPTSICRACHGTGMVQ